MKQHKAFTIIELIFVIVVLGILASVAIPRMSSTINDANIGKAKSDVAAVRSAIASERQQRFLRGETGYISALDRGGSNPTVIFDDNDSDTANGSLLLYGVTTGTSEGKWRKTANDTYAFKAEGGVDVIFTYAPATGMFTCTRGNDTAGELCKKIID